MFEKIIFHSHFTNLDISGRQHGNSALMSN